MGKLKKVFGFKCEFNQISNILTKFHQTFDTNWFLKASVCIENIAFKWVSIDPISWFYVYDLLFEDFVFWYGHMDLPTCQNIGKEIDWGHEMMLLLMPLTCAQGKSQYQCKWTKTCEILITFNEKHNISQILKIITHDIMIPLQNFILLNQQVQNMSLPTIYMSYTKFHPDQL
jgi:hypothetical protein